MIGLLNSRWMPQTLGCWGSLWYCCLFCFVILLLLFFFCFCFVFFIACFFLVCLFCFWGFFFFAFVVLLFSSLLNVPTTLVGILGICKDSTSSSPSADNILPNAWQGSHKCAISVTKMTQLGSVLAYTTLKVGALPQGIEATISRVSDQNGVSPLYIMLEIHHSGQEPSIYGASCWNYLHSANADNEIHEEEMETIGKCKDLKHHIGDDWTSLLEHIQKQDNKRKKHSEKGKENKNTHSE